MNIEWSFKKIALIAGAAIILIGTNVSQYFVLWGPKQEKLKQTYEQQVATLQGKLDKLGPMVGIWTIKDDAQNIFPGKQIEESDLNMREIPESLVSPSFVLDPQPILGKYYRISLLPGTPLSLDFAMDEPLDDTTREYDVVSNIMPIGLKVGDYIDFRIVYPLGEDYIVLTHKRVEAVNDKTVKLKMNEQEIHFYQAALIDYFLQAKNGATLYLAKYVEPGVQKAASPYYAIPKNILAIMIADPNIVKQLDGNLNEATRKLIDTGLSNVIPEAGQAVSSGRSEIAGKIDSGSNEMKNEEKDRLEAEAQAAAANPAGTNPAPQAGNPAQTTSPAGNSNSSTSQAPALDIEKGVVE